MLGKYILLLSLAICVKLSSCTSCTKQSSCKCAFNNGSKIDLSSLANNDGTARYKDIPDKNIGGSKYSWNPCYPFTEGTCKSVSACQIEGSGETEQQFPTGTQKSAQFKDDPTLGLVIEYSALHEVTRTTIIQIICDPDKDAEVTVGGESPPQHYHMSIRGRQVCAGSGSGGGGEGLSVGSVLVIILVSLIFVYVGAGIAIQIFVRKASGRESVPNYSFWSTLPGMIKSGVLFTFTCGKRGKQYDQI
ncbi:hypothetical protein ScPMuIL_016126 [Solemya velum]